MNEEMRFNVQQENAQLPVQRDEEVEEQQPVQEQQSSGMEEAVTQNPVANETNRVDRGIAAAFTLPPDVVSSVFVGSPTYVQRPVPMQTEEGELTPGKKKHTNIMLDRGLKLFE